MIQKSGEDKMCGTVIDLEIASRYLSSNDENMEFCNKIFESNRMYYPNSSHFHLAWATFVCVHAQNPCAALFILSKVRLLLTLLTFSRFNTITCHFSIVLLFMFVEIMPYTF
jgi:hypothetical protein